MNELEKVAGRWVKLDISSLCQASQHSAFWKSGQVKELALEHTHHIVAAEPAEISFGASCRLPRIQDRSPRSHSIYSLRYNHSWLRILPFDTASDRCWGASLVAQLQVCLQLRRPGFNPQLQQKKKKKKKKKRASHVHIWGLSSGPLLPSVGHMEIAQLIL